MTACEMIPAVGATVLVECGEISVECSIVDVKSAWGKARLLVVPSLGTGRMYVELSRVRLVSAPSAYLATR